MQLITLCTIFLWQWTTKWRETNPILMRVKVRWLSSERPPVLATEYFLSFSTLFWCFCRWEADFSSCSWWQADVISKWDLVRLVSTQKRPNIPYLCSTAHVGIFLLNKVWRLKTVEWCCYQCSCSGYRSLLLLEDSRQPIVSPSPYTHVFPVKYSQHWN